MSLTNAWPETYAEKNPAKRALFFYFFHGDKNINSVEEFAERWNKIPDYDWTPKDLVTIVHKTMSHVRQYYTTNLFAGIRNFLRDNLDVWEQAALPLLPGFIPKDLTLSLWSFSSFESEPSREFMEGWQNAARSKMPEFVATDLAIGLMSLARLCEEPIPALMEEWDDATVRKLANFVPKELGNSLWAVCVMDLISPEYDGAPLAATFLKAIEGKSQNIAQAHQVYTASRYFDLPSDIVPEPEGDMISSLENHFAAMLHNHGYSFKRQHSLPAIHHHTDFYLPSRSGKRLLIETDGQWHFTKQPRTEGLCHNYNGGTYLKSALMCKYYPDDTVLRLPSDDFTTLRKLPFKKQSDALFKMLDGAYDIGSGVYRVACDNGDISFNVIAQLARQNAPVFTAPSPTP